MSTESDKMETRKAMAYDLIDILEANPQQQTYTIDEIKKMIKTYINTTATT